MLLALVLHLPKDVTLSPGATPRGRLHFWVDIRLRKRRFPCRRQADKTPRVESHYHLLPRFDRMIQQIFSRRVHFGQVVTEEAEPLDFAMQVELELPTVPN